MELPTSPPSLQPPLPPTPPNPATQTSMATITVLYQAADSAEVFTLLDKIKRVVGDTPGVMLDVRYRTTP